jgi:hypothetical protein
MMMVMMIHPQMHRQVMLPHHDQDLLSCTNLFEYGIVVFGSALLFTPFALVRLNSDLYASIRICQLPGKHGPFRTQEAGKRVLGFEAVSAAVFFAFNLSAPELGPNTCENVFSEYNTMQIQ